jgi:hypothetical protein
MTIPVERSYAIHNTKQFLYDLLRPDKTPKVPKAIRERSRRLLRHYPSNWDINYCSKKCPDTFGPIDAALDFEVEWEKMKEEKRKEEKQNE